MSVQATYYAGGTGYTPADMLQREADWVSPGVLSSSDLVVAQTTVASMAVTVSGAAQGQVGGNAWLPGGYRIFNDALATLAITTANATNPRIDLIVACIDTTTSPYTPSVKVITGTPAASPTVPSIPAGLVAIPLAQIYVAANVTSIVSSNITDIRVKAGLIAQSGDDPIAAQLSDRTKIPGCIDDTGTANTYVITLATAPTAYAKYQTFRFVAKTTNTGASTLNVNGLGAKAIKKNVTSDLVVGDILAGQVITVTYDGTNFQIVPMNVTTGIFSGDLNNLTSPGLYSGGILTNAPDSGYYYIEVINNGSNSWVLQRVTLLYDSKISYTRIKNSSGVWTGWLQAATTETTVLTLLNGWTQGYGTSPRVSRSGNLVAVNMRIKGGTINSVVCNLPTQYRCGGGVYFNVINPATGAIIGSCGIEGDGNLGVNVSSNTDIFISCSYSII